MDNPVISFSGEQGSAGNPGSLLDALMVPPLQIHAEEEEEEEEDEK